MSHLALKLIREAKATRATRLDLGNCGLEELPEELFELVWLEELVLSREWLEYSFEKKDWIKFTSQNQGEPNTIKFIPPDIKKLEGLKKLIASGQWRAKWELSDLSPLSNLTNLKELYVSETKARDLSPLAKLTNLNLLSISSAEVSDLSPLAKLTNLNSLFVSHAPVSDLSPLANLANLNGLFVYHTIVSDLSPLANLTNLNWLDVNSTQVSDLSPLTNLTNLNWLDVTSTQVSDLSPLANLINLNSLKVYFTQVSDLNPLAKLTNLKELNVFDARVSDLSPLANLTNLYSLDVLGTQVCDLSPLANLTSLYSLDVSSTQVRDLSPLKRLVNLKRLNVRNNPITYIPKETYDQQNCAQSLQAYWREIDHSQKATNTQLKIMFLGNGCVGKTTLLHWFIDNAFKNIGLEWRTHGIIIQPWPLDDGNILANFWDFGGQEVYHATHRLFLGKRTLYLLVWASETPEREEEMRHPPQYWLDMIADIADQHERSRVIIVQNQFEGALLHETILYCESRYLPNFFKNSVDYLRIIWLQEAFSKQEMF
ncbi:MAG: leucine-rich repeat domain-containing protein, partial [Saprospiraceae bacterium]